MSIQSRIFIGFLFVLAVGFSSLLYWVVDDLKPQFRKATEEPLVDASRVLASLAATTSHDGRVDTELFRRVFTDTYSRPFSATIYGFTKTGVDYRVYITDGSGRVVFDSFGGKDEGRDYSLWNDVRRTLDGRYGARTTEEVPGDPSSSVMYVAAPIISGGRTIGVLSVGKPSTSVNQFAEDERVKIIVGGLAIGFTALLAGMFLSWRITAPIKRLTEYARSVRDGERAALPRLAPAETRELGEAFEEMRSALDGKQYVEDYIQTLTHEVKGPISAIRGATELLGEDPPPDQRTRFLANIRNETDRIGAVVEKLLLLSSLEKLGRLHDIGMVDMREVASAVKESLFPVLGSRRVELSFAGHGSFSVEGDPFLIRQAVSNLVQNALDFSPLDAKVDVEVLALEGGVAVNVRDRGPGIPEYARDRIFERFYSLKRPDTGRKSSGLGLCLVKEVAALHNGAISLMNSTAGGVTATLTLPRKPA